MPGINQLKQFDNDILPIGDEPEIRRKNGTTMPEVAMPENLPEGDDSLDFEFGLPQREEEADESAVGDEGVSDEAAAAGGSAEAESADTGERSEDAALPEQPPIPSMEDLDPDIAAFLAGTAPSPAPSSRPAPQAQDDSTDTASDSADTGALTAADEALSTGAGTAEPDEGAEQAESTLSDSAGAASSAQSSPFADGFDLDDLDMDSSFLSSSAPASKAEDTDSAPADLTAQTESPAESAESADLTPQDESSDEAEPAKDFSASDEGFNLNADLPAELDEGFNLNADLPDELNEGFSHKSDFTDTDLAAAAKDFALDDDIDFEGPAEEVPAEEAGDLQNVSEADAGENGSHAFGADDTDLDSFEIPGFSDTVAPTASAQIFRTTKKKGAQTDEDFDRTYLSEQEYKRFRENLHTYPLNVRIAVEQLIAKNEFTDAAVMEVLFKVIKKVSARQLAAHLEKMLDISISVPLNFERRTAEQYAMYKTSLEYQLKNRIIPGAIVALVLGGILYILGFLGVTFIYRPLKAESLYRSGYNLIGQELYAQSEANFNEALTYKVKKKWFFRYARAYREKRQYGRAAVMYEQLVKRFRFDKEGALEYAHMEADDLADYARAAEIVRRFVLDYHINDKDAMLFLGDIYLDWAGTDGSDVEKAERFEQARLQYSTLMSLYGSNDVYLSRMLRYFIRTDNLREVLPLKTYFTSTKKIALDAQDIIDLGGYLLEKQYGYLPPSDEYLRGYIDNVKKVLEQGIKADPTIPEGHYNLSRYFLRTGDSEQAKTALINALAMFDAAKKQSRERTLKHIDTYRLLGERYIAEQEYLLAEKQYAEGISLFEQRREYTGLTSDKNVGRLYADMADIDYFISGDIQTAFRNYKAAVGNGYDTPSVRYRIGFVQYTDGNYAEALGSFIKTASEDASNRNLLLALGNVLSIRGDQAAARGYYERLIRILDSDRERFGILFPQVREDQYALVDLYLKASNNLGVTLSRLAVQTGNSSLQAQAIAQFAESVRAWDALTRNQKTMVRLEGSNLAAQNIKYITYPQRSFEPAIYAAISPVLYGETGLKQYSLE